MKKLLSILLVVTSLVSISFAEGASLEDIPCYGTPTDTSTLRYLINGTEETIVELRLKPELEDEQQEDAELSDLLEGNSFTAGAKIGVWVEMQVLAESDDSAPLYEVIVTFEDAEVRTLHHVAVADIEEAIICRDENVTWLIYTSLTTGEEISTWLDELNILAEQETDDSPLDDDSDPEDTAGNDDWNS